MKLQSAVARFGACPSVSGCVLPSGHSTVCADADPGVDWKVAPGRLVPGKPVGRPAVGNPVIVRLPVEVIAEIDAAAASAGWSRSEEIRRRMGVGA